MECQNLIFKKDKAIIKEKKIPNLKIWLLLWYNNSPPSVEYIEKLLIIPIDTMQINKTKSKDLNFWKKVNWPEYIACWYIYAGVKFWFLVFSLISCLSTINLNNFFVIGAAIELPDPACSTITLTAYLGFL